MLSNAAPWYQSGLEGLISDQTEEDGESMVPLHIAIYTIEFKPWTM